MTGEVAGVPGRSRGIGTGMVAGYRLWGWLVVATARPVGAGGPGSGVVDGILFVESSLSITWEILQIGGGQSVGH